MADWQQYLNRLFAAWLFGSLGLGVSCYFAMPILLATGYALLAQQAIPDWSIRDVASLGGFGVFAMFMSWLHVRTVDKHAQATEMHQKIILKMVEKGYDLPPSDNK